MKWKNKDLKREDNDEKTNVKSNQVKLSIF